MRREPGARRWPPSRWRWRWRCRRRASAHGLVGKQDLPIPRWLFAWAAAVVLVASFVGLAVLWATPRLQAIVERRRFGVARALEVVFGLVGVALFAFVVYAGFAGTQARDGQHPADGHLRLLLGRHPVRQRGLRRRLPRDQPVAGDRQGRRLGAEAHRARWTGVEPLPYPARLGRWPAVIGVLIFAWVELVYANKDDPSQLAIMALAYAAVQLVGMSLYGAETWSRRGDAFGVYFEMFARISPLHWRDRALFTRPVLGGAPPLTPVAGTVALLCTMIGTTSFDGFSQGTTWNSIVPHLQDFFGSLGFNAEHALEWAGTVGIVVMCCLIGLLYRLGVMGMHTVGRRLSTRDLSGAFIHTLIPIAFAYVLAHYFSLVAYQGQAIAALASDPLGDGSDLLGTAARDHQLHVDQRDGHLVRPGRRARPRPRRRPHARPRPRAGALHQGARRDTVAVLDACGHGRVHQPRPVAALGGGAAMIAAA